MIKVLFFGPVAERVGTGSLLVEHRRGLRMQDLFDALSQLHPRAFDIVCFTAVDGVHVRDLSRILDDHSEVAFMARFSGG